MEEHVAHELPDHQIVSDAPGDQPEVQFQESDSPRPGQHLENEHRYIEGNQRLHRRVTGPPKNAEGEPA